MIWFISKRNLRLYIVVKTTHNINVRDIPKPVSLYQQRLSRREGLNSHDPHFVPLPSSRTFRSIKTKTSSFSSLNLTKTEMLNFVYCTAIHLISSSISLNFTLDKLISEESWQLCLENFHHIPFFWEVQLNDLTRRCIIYSNFVIRIWILPVHEHDGWFSNTLWNVLIITNDPPCGNKQHWNRFQRRYIRINWNTLS